MKRYVVVALVYTQIGFLTGFYRYHHVPDDHPFRSMADTFCGALWPVYWNARVAEWMVS